MTNIPKNPDPFITYKGKVCQVNLDCVNIEKTCSDVLKTHLTAKRNWTAHDQMVFAEIASQYRALLVAMLFGKDISEDLYTLDKRARTLAANNSFDGVKAIQEFLYIWLGRIYDCLAPR